MLKSVMVEEERRARWAAKAVRIGLTYGVFGCDAHMPAYDSHLTLRLHLEVMARHRLRPYHQLGVNVPLMTDARTGFFAC